MDDLALAFAFALAPDPAHDPFSSLSPLDDLFADWLLPPAPATASLPALDYPSSPSASDTASSVETDPGLPSAVPLPLPLPPAAGFRLTVADVPLLAPRPLPYHSPTFLQFDLPDTDEDLSHPPYTHRPPKRKRGPCEGERRPPRRRRTAATHAGAQDEDTAPPPAKRRAHIHAWRSRVHREHEWLLQQQQQLLQQSWPQQHPHPPQHCPFLVHGLH